MSSTINCGYLATIQAMADKIWVDSIKNAADNTPDVMTARAVLENQNVNFSMLQTKDKDNIVSLEWLAPDCTADEDQCEDDCTFTGADATPVCQEYELDICRSEKFGVPYKTYRDRTIDRMEAIAHNFVQKVKLLDNKVATAVATAIHANVGVNIFTGGIGTVAGTTTTIPAAYWNAAMFGYFAQVVVNNKFNNPYLIDGNNLFQVIWQAMMDRGNDNGKGAYAKINSIKAYQDPFILETVAAAHTFLLHGNAMALIHKTYYPLGAANGIEFEGGKYLKYSIDSYGIPGIQYDVIVRQDCSSNDHTDYFKIEFNGGVFLNPTGCTATRTGVLQFVCG